jgi:hypothetical protein
MERDGVFLNPDGSRKVASDGTPINAETCAEALTSSSCLSSFKTACPTARTYSQAFMSDLKAAENNNVLNLPATCAEATDPEQMDPRIDMFIDTLEGRDDVCRPGEQTAYINRIGNNLCYIGQCAEQTLELHRITGGRESAVVQGEAFPYDDPATGSELGTIINNTPEYSDIPPPYQPGKLLRELELKLCQLQGLPPQTPPALCTFQAGRRLSLPLMLYHQNTDSLLTQTQQQKDATAETLSLGLALGTRAGTDLIKNQMNLAANAIADILASANSLMQELDTIDFPTQMCPLDSTPTRLSPL